jgi:hypothetical protein
VSVYVHPMQRLKGALTIAFYSALVALIVAIMFELLPSVTSDLIAGRIARNSEGIVLLLIIAAWIQFARPHLAKTTRQWPISLGVAVVCLALGLLLFFTDPNNRVKTLNETFLAASVLIPYMQLPRPIPRAVPLGISGAFLLLVLVGNTNPTITLMAEAMAALIMTPIALDIVDKGILDANATTVRAVRYAWYTFLVIGPLVFWATDNGATVSGWLGDVLTYAGRTTEVFLCLLILELYFAVGHGRIGRVPKHVRHEELVTR